MFVVRVFVCGNETEAIIYENINFKAGRHYILIYTICCGQRVEPQQLGVLFAAVPSITAVIELATVYLLRLGP